MTKDCGAAASFLKTRSARRRLDDAIGRKERLKDAEYLGRVPLRRAFDAAEHFAFAADQKAGRQTPRPEGVPDLALGIDIDLDRFEPEFGDERLDGLVAAAVFRYRKHGYS